MDNNYNTTNWELKLRIGWKKRDWLPPVTRSILKWIYFKNFYIQSNSSAKKIRLEMLFSVTWIMTKNYDQCKQAMEINCILKQELRRLLLSHANRWISCIMPSQVAHWTKDAASNCEQHRTFYRTHYAPTGPIAQLRHTFYMQVRNRSDLNILCC